MGKLYLFFRAKSSRSIKGFTLIELLVVIAMVGVMTSFLFLFLDPFTQINKARDAQRQQDFKQINNALDAYYNDKNCYPSSLVFGQEWKDSATGVVYMKKVPQDPNCTGGGSCYTYVVDPNLSTCPQWNILFTKIYESSVNSSTCALDLSCLPSNYSSSGYNYCALSGEVDCATISSLSLPANAGGTGGSGGTGGAGGTSTPTPGSTSTPTPTPCSKDYSCRGSPLRCNVISPAGSGEYCASNCDGVCP